MLIIHIFFNMEQKEELTITNDELNKLKEQMKELNYILIEKMHN